MKKITVFILFSVLTTSVFAQKYNIISKSNFGIPIADISLSADLGYVVAQDSDARISFPAAVFTNNARKDILAVYLKTDTARHIVFTSSSDGGKSWNKENIGDQWKSELLSLSMFNLGKTVFKRVNEKSHLEKNNMIIFAGGVPMKMAASYSMGAEWSPFSNANNFGGYKVSGLVQLKSSRLMAFMHDDGRFISGNNDIKKLRKSAIYKIYSDDGGLTWSKPNIAIKHNLHGLYDATIVRSDLNSNTLISIASERERNNAYISFSLDEGDTWSYPHKLPDFICGDRFALSVIKHKIYIVFRDMSKELQNGETNPTFGDIVMWTGDIKDLMEDGRSGIKVRIADNYPVANPDFNDRKVYDCGYPSILPLSKKTLSVIAYGRWEANEEPYIKNFVVDCKLIRNIRTNL